MFQLSLIHVRHCRQCFLLFYLHFYVDRFAKDFISLSVVYDEESTSDDVVVALCFVNISVIVIFSVSFFNWCGRRLYKCCYHSRFSWIFFCLFVSRLKMIFMLVYFATCLDRSRFFTVRAFPKKSILSIE